MYNPDGEWRLSGKPLGSVTLGPNTEWPTAKPKLRDLETTTRNHWRSCMHAARLAKVMLSPFFRHFDRETRLDYDNCDSGSRSER